MLGLGREVLWRLRCSPRDAVSFFLGLANIVRWAVCGLPQILDNYRSDDAEGLSLTFIFAWLIGDIFNVVGCYISNTVRCARVPGKHRAIAPSLAASVSSKQSRLTFDTRSGIETFLYILLIMLAPAQLPTQLYTAVLYTLITVVLLASMCGTAASSHAGGEPRCAHAVT
jgi:hypothetical protein